MGKRPPGIRRARQGLARLAAPASILGLGLWGCAGVADYATAKPLPRGGIEVAPHATGFAVFVPERFEGRGIPQHWSAGATAGYGLTGGIDLLANYEYVEIEAPEGADFGPLSVTDQRIALTIKFAWDPMREAFSLGYGYHPDNRFHELSAAHYTNLYWNRRFYYCFSPVVTAYATGRSGADWLFNPVFNQSLTWEPTRHFFLRPQVGINVFGIFLRSLILNAGLAAGASF